MIKSPITAGDTLDFTEALPDYPATDGWTLHHSLFSSSQFYKFESVAAGNDHKTTISAATTAAWVPGRYDWASYVTNIDGRRHQVATGPIIISADPSTGPSDGRTHARKMLDAVEAIIEKRATGDELDLVRGVFGSREIERDGKLIELRDKYRLEVRGEESVAKIARGEKPKNKIKFRFTRGG